jgi:hypothetical protein
MDEINNNNNNNNNNMRHDNHKIIKIKNAQENAGRHQSDEEMR